MTSNKSSIAGFETADRLNVITQRAGFALWQIQELEQASASYFVLLAKATPDTAAQGQTFGQTISQLRAANLLSADHESRLLALLRERNWLVHSSRADSRAVVYSKSQFESLQLRLDKIAEEALAMLREVAVLSERHLIAHGVAQSYIDNAAATLLKEWRESDAI